MAQDNKKDFEDIDKAITTFFTPSDDSTTSYDSKASDDKNREDFIELFTPKFKEAIKKTKKGESKQDDKIDKILKEQLPSLYELAKERRGPEANRITRFLLWQKSAQVKSAITGIINLEGYKNINKKQIEDYKESYKEIEQDQKNRTLPPLPAKRLNIPQSDSQLDPKDKDNKISKEILSNMTHVAYSVREPKEKTEEKLTKLHDLCLKKDQEGWELLMTSEKDDQFQYKAAIFINKTKDRIVIANAGTRINAQDILDDIGLIFRYAPTGKMLSMKSLIDGLDQKLKEQEIIPERCKFTTTGHSLGAILSDLCAIELTGRKYQVDYSKTFENPGFAPIMENALKEKRFSNKDLESKDFAQVKFRVINATTNMINGLNEQLGKAINIDVSKLIDQSKSSYIAMGIQYLTKLRDHSLTNFSQSGDLAASIMVKNSKRKVLDDSFTLLPNNTPLKKTLNSSKAIQSPTKTPQVKIKPESKRSNTRG